MSILWFQGTWIVQNCNVDEVKTKPAQTNESNQLQCPKCSVTFFANVCWTNHRFDFDWWSRLTVCAAGTGHLKIWCLRKMKHVTSWWSTTVIYLSFFRVVLKSYKKGTKTAALTICRDRGLTLSASRLCLETCIVWSSVAIWWLKEWFDEIRMILGLIKMMKQEWFIKCGSWQEDYKRMVRRGWWRRCWLRSFEPVGWGMKNREMRTMPSRTTRRTSTGREVSSSQPLLHHLECEEEAFWKRTCKRCRESRLARQRIRGHRQGVRPLASTWWIMKKADQFSDGTREWDSGSDGKRLEIRRDWRRSPRCERCIDPWDEICGF